MAHMQTKKLPVRETSKSEIGITAAVMDLGTNTFHLLIASGDAANPEELFHTTVPVKLGEGGINNGIIQPAAYQRGIDTMLQFSGHISTFNVDKISAIGTSALRSARNGADFINEVKAKTGIEIEIIDGEREAEYIYEGVKAGKCLTDQNSLILDIGGGSVEFIIGNKENILWRESFEIGAARMLDKFHRTDPIPQSSINELKAYLEQTLPSFFEAAKDIEIYNIIGSSGAFETFAEVIELQKGHPFELKNNRKYQFDNEEFIKITDWLIQSSHNERENTEGIILIRVDMIVSSSLITRFVMEKLGISNVLMSTYSLKEGVLAEALEN
jgi:exopolyphosphatase/guanosine-5'-triphosphate,3'-diphosphate pyrophosphatase